MKSKRAIPIAASALVSLGLIVFLLSRIEISELTATLRAIHAPSLAAFILCSLANSGLRALRFGWLLAPRRVSAGGIVLVTFVRNLFVDLLPARLGSLSYIYFVNRHLGCPFAAAASSLVISIVFDFLTLSPFLMAAFLLSGIVSPVLPAGTVLAVSAVFFAILTALLYYLAPLISHLSHLTKALLHRLGRDRKHWAAQLIEKLEATSRDVRAVERRKISLPLFGLSTLIRLAKYAALFFLLHSLLHNRGFTLAELNFPKTILGITGAEMSSALPIKGIGGFGTWESAWALAFRLLDFPSELAVVSGIGVHLITNFFEYILGIAAMLVLSARAWIPRPPRSLKN